MVSQIERVILESSPQTVNPATSGPLLLHNIEVDCGECAAGVYFAEVNCSTKECAFLYLAAGYLTLRATLKHSFLIKFGFDCAI